MIGAPEALVATPDLATPAGSMLAQQALAALAASTQAPVEEGTIVEERSVYRPDSWLMQRCWEVLADAGATAECLRIAGLAASRQPLAPVQSLYRLARQLERHPELASAVSRELAAHEWNQLSGLDILVRGFAKNGDDSRHEVVLAIEASTVIDGDDVDRAFRRAEILKRTGYDARAWVGGASVTTEAEDLARRNGVQLLVSEALAQ